MKKTKRIFSAVLLSAVLLALLCIPASAADADVSGAIESTWTAASGQLKTIVNDVVFPALDMILAIFFFIKLGSAYFDCAPVRAM